MKLSAERCLIMYAHLDVGSDSMSFRNDGANGSDEAPSGRSQSDGKPAGVRAEAWQIFVQANEARAAAGISPLAWNESLANAARKHCVRMSLEARLFAHRYKGEQDLSSRAGEAGAHFSFIVENLAVGPRLPTFTGNGWTHSITAPPF